MAAAAGSLIYVRANQAQVEYEDVANQQAKADNDAARIQTQNRCGLVPSLERPACIDAERHATRERERQERDLQAQLVTSAWTRAMGEAALIGMFVGIIGVGLIYTTLRETQRTAQIAQENLDAFKDLERPRLIPDLSGADPALDEWGESSGFLMQIPVKNAGRSSAHVTGVAVALLDSGAYREGMKVEPAGSMVISGDRSAVWSLAFDWDIARTHVGGFVIYRSSFGEHRTYFCYRLEPDPDVEGIGLCAEKGDDWPSDT